MNKKRCWRRESWKVRLTHRRRRKRRVAGTKRRNRRRERKGRAFEVEKDARREEKTFTGLVCSDRRRIETPENWWSRNRVYRGGSLPITGEERTKSGEEGLRRRYQRKEEIGLVAGDELFDFGLNFEDIESEIDERKEETIRLSQKVLAELRTVESRRSWVV